MGKIAGSLLSARAGDVCALKTVGKHDIILRTIRKQL